MSLSLITEILKDYEKPLGEHGVKYHNHACRVYELACEIGQSGIEEQYILAVAAAFHDLGIWTHSTIDYLGPSEELAKKYLINNGRPELIPAVLSCIDLHHKLRTIKQNPLAEAFRKADLIDLSFGLFRFGIKKAEISRLNKTYPQAGFHRFIGFKLLENMLKKPWNPLPIVKW